MTVDVTIIDSAGRVLRRVTSSSKASAKGQAEGDEIAILERAPDGTKRVGEEWVRIEEGDELDIALERSQAQLRVGMFIDQARRRYITVIPGQEMVYTAKEAEARAFITAGSPDDTSDFPLLAAETGTTAETPDQLAQLWLNMAAIWRQAAAELEPIRLNAGAAIDAAETKAEIDAAVATLRAAIAPITSG